MPIGRRSVRIVVRPSSRIDRTHFSMTSGTTSRSPARSTGAERGMRVSLFITCFNDTIFPGTGRAVVRVLERLGHSVDFPRDQTCCGQMHYNTGYQREAIPLVRRFVQVFDKSEVIVSPSASCVGMVRHLYPKAA